jgi:multidrug efflux pump subunit AcrA (membrane-fusion protein)/DNA-binding NarL/FixJ family response regulator
MIRIAIADDDLFIRQILSAYLKSESDFEVVGIADDGKEAIDIVSKFHPDVILLDLEMPEMDGLSATEIICRRYPETKVAILSSHDREDYVTQAIETGAVGYLFKNIPAEELAQTIRLIHRGYLQIAPGLSCQLSSSIAANTKKTATVEVPKINNTHRLQNLNALPTVELDQFIPPLDRVTKIGGTILFSLFGTAILLTSILRYKVTVKAPAVVRPAGELRLVQTAVAGQISRINIKENQNVEAGFAIANLENSQLQLQQLEGLKNVKQSQQQLKQIELQINDIKKEIKAQTKVISKLIASGRANLNLKNRDYREQKITTATEFTKAKAAAKLAKEELSRYRKLVNTGAISRLQISEKEANLEQAQARVKQVQATLNPSRAKITIAAQQLDREIAEQEAKIAALDREKESLVEKKITINKQLDRELQQLQRVDIDLEKSILRSPIAGIIQELNLRNQNQIVSSGEIVATVAPTQTPLVVKAAVASGEINKLEKGQSVELRVFACPYTDYGTLPGQITAIAPDISNPGNKETNDPETATYEVTIQPKYLVWKGNSHECRMQFGMGAIADIVTREETILTFWLRKARLLTNL